MEELDDDRRLGRNPASRKRVSMVQLDLPMFLVVPYSLFQLTTLVLRVSRVGVMQDLRHTCAVELLMT